MKRKIFQLFLVVVLITVGIFAYHTSQNSTKATGDLGSLTENTRGVTLVIYENNQPVFSQLVLGYIYNEKYVVVPYTIFYAPTATGRVDILNFLTAEVSIKLFLGANPDTEDEWKKEELGEIRFSDEAAGFAIVERTSPVFGVKESAYIVGQYDQLKVGDPLYLVSQENGALTIKPSTVSRLFSKDGKNLISVPGISSYQEWGGLAFNKNLELVGMFCVIGELVANTDDMVFVYFLDINQIIEEIEKLK